MSDGIMLQFGEDGAIKEYKEPYTIVECETEKDYNDLVGLIEKGKQAEEIEKQNKIYERFVETLIDNISKEIESDGNCRMVVSLDVVEEWKKILETSTQTK